MADRGRTSGDIGPASAGILVVNKPRGLTSRAVVDRVAGLVGRVKVGSCRDARSAGHGRPGRLRRAGDPAGRGDPGIAQVVSDGGPPGCAERHARRRRADRVRGGSAESRHRREVAAAVGSADWRVDQMPPDYSALKVRGRRAYDLARAGQAVELAPRRVRIDRIAVLRYDWPRLELEIDCGGGTYIRSIARDIGEALGCGGLVEILVRTRIGPFTLDGAVDLAGTLGRIARSAVPAMPRGGRRHAAAGARPGPGRGRRRGPAAVTRDFAEPDDFRRVRLALVDPDGRLVALAESNPSKAGSSRARCLCINSFQRRRMDRSTRPSTRTGRTWPIDGRVESEATSRPRRNRACELRGFCR